MIVADLTQHLDRGDHSLGVLALDAGLFVRVRAQRDIKRIVLLPQLVEGHVVADVDVYVRVDADREHRRDLRIQHLARQAVGRDAVAQHSAQLRALFVHRDPVPHQRKVIGSRKPARTAADDADAFSRCLRAFRVRHVACIVHRVALEPADVDCVVDHVAAAARLAGMLADIRAGRGEGIVLADQAHGVGIAAVLDQHQIARDIHARGAQRHAGHRLAHPTKAAVTQDMFFIIVAKARKPVEHQPRRVAPNGAVGAVDDHARHALDHRNGLHRRLALKHLLHQCGKLSQPDAAGHALSAGLRMAQIQKALGKVYRAQPRRAGGDTPLHIAVQPVDHGLCAGWRHDIKSRQDRSSLRSLQYAVSVIDIIYNILSSSIFQ